jgi:hypothetical protein
MARRNTDRGGAAVEFAMLLPLFLMLIFAMLEYSWVMLSQASLGSAARDGCRHGAVVAPWNGPGSDGSIAEAQDVIDARLEAFGVSCASAACEISVEIEGERPDQVLTCRIARDYQPIIGLLPTPDQLSTTASTWLEYPR